MLKKSILAGLLGAALAAGAVAQTLPAQPAPARGKLPLARPAPASSVLFDQGPSTGTNGGCWLNYTGIQDFSDAAPLPPGTVVTGIVIHTCSAPTGGNVKFKVADEDSHAIVYTESGPPADWSSVGTNVYAVTYTLATPYVVPASGRLGYGLSGEGFDMGQYSVLTPVDGLMSQYEGNRWVFNTTVGDQMFQLLGESEGDRCDVNGDGSYTPADLSAYRQECKASGQKGCNVKTLKFARSCGIAE